MKKIVDKYHLNKQLNDVLENNINRFKKFRSK